MGLVAKEPQAGIEFLGLLQPAEASQTSQDIAAPFYLDAISYGLGLWASIRAGITSTTYASDP